MPLTRCCAQRGYHWTPADQRTRSLPRWSRWAVELDVEPGFPWAAAFPGPFDYENGVGRFADVGKFDALLDVDVRSALASGLGSDNWHFVNDADAFALGVWAAGSGEGRLVCLTLGTGVGSAFVADGVCVRSGPTVPPDAEMHLTLWNGKPLEETTSHRAIVGAYAAATGVVLPGVREVVERSRAGDAAAAAALRSAFVSLGRGDNALVATVRSNRPGLRRLGGAGVGRGAAPRL